jgi:D-glycero-D-manno-heptose 1,7-bisphosphate phosphatase
MKWPAIFFDRDNTIILNDGYLGDPSGIRLAPGAAGAVARAKDLGFRVVTISNQSGVARGLFSEDAVRGVNARMDELLRQSNPRAIIDQHEFCPFHPEAIVAIYRIDSDLRKPKPGMIWKAARELDLDLPRSWVVGDAGRDIEAGKAAGCRTILIRWPGIAQSSAAEVESTVAPDATVHNLDEAMNVIAAGR